MLKAIFFDLDGTLLNMDEEEFTKGYFKLISEKLAPKGYKSEELIRNIWSSTLAMYKNDGSITNEEAFWSSFKKLYKHDVIKDKEFFDDFYVNEFKNTVKYCNVNDKARKIIDFCKENVEHVILSTNPIFPRCATLTRMSFIGLKEDDFDFITTYENSRFTKPNTNYFIELLKKFNLKSDEVILFGNNTIEDGDCSFDCGIKTYILKENKIDKGSERTYEEISIDDVVDTIKKEISLRK